METEVSTIECKSNVSKENVSLSLSKREVEGKVEVKEQEQVEAVPLVPSEAELRGSALSVETNDFEELFKPVETKKNHYPPGAFDRLK